ncbi:MAG: chloride channel protein [Thermodesulfobacteriota bacterium]
MLKIRFPKENIVALLLIAVLIGMTTGCLAVGFRYLLIGAVGLFWGDSSNIIEAAYAMPWYLKLLIPAGGGLLVGPIIAFLAPETRGAGVPEVIETVIVHEGVIRHRTTLFKMLTTVISIGTGASVGREGPIVHIGASVGSSLAQIIKLPSEWKRVFLACGAAAGIAATFNAPMAGMLFAAEIILVDFQVSYLSHIAISSITATVISYHFLGVLPAFTVPKYTLLSYWEIPLYVILGLMAGGISIAFIRLTSGVEDTFSRLKIPVYIRPAMGGFAVGIIALWLPHVLGVGYESVNLVFTTKAALGLMLLIIVFKLLATCLSVGSGLSGGIFAPSLVLGSMLGGAFGIFFHALFPASVAPFPAYALVGMGAVVAGSTLAPITAIFTIFELTYDFQIILPLMTSCIASLVIVQSIQGHSIYESKLIKKGIKLVRGRDINILRSMRVGDYMEKGFGSILESTPLGEIILRFEESDYPHFLVFNKERELTGMLSVSDLRPIMAEMKDLCELVVAGEIMTRGVETIGPFDNFETAFNIFEGKQISTLPVVGRDNPKKVLGILKKSSLLMAYNQKVLKHDSLMLKRADGK